MAGLRVSLLLVFVLAAVAAFGESQARIVRLGDTQGDVRIDRNTGQGFEKAFLNLPITQGMKIQTGNDGRATLELEDSSTLRLTPGSVLEISKLSLADSGAKVSGFHLQEGGAYVNLVNAKDNRLSVSFARETISFDRPANVRIEMGDTNVSVAVFKGDVQIAAPDGSVQVSKGKAADYNLVNDHHEIASQIEDQPLDAWDKQQNQYQQEYSSKSYSNYSPYAYGTSDLNYYGNFLTVPGYGSVWQPFFAGAGWDPFMNGAWAFYPGSGYGWVSTYPWGWTPYHYGSWNYLPPYGWFWQPGGNWVGTNATPVVPHAPLHFNGPQAPASPGMRMQAVNHGPQTQLVGKSLNHLQIPSNSAGMGIPRGEVMNLRDLSHTAERKGAVTTGLHTPSTGFGGWWNGGNSGYYGHGQNGSFGPSHVGTAAPAASAGHAGASHGGAHR